MGAKISIFSDFSYLLPTMSKREKSDRFIDYLYERDLEARIATILREMIREGLESGYRYEDLITVLQNIFRFMLRQARNGQFPFEQNHS